MNGSVESISVETVAREAVDWRMVDIVNLSYNGIFSSYTIKPAERCSRL